MICGLLSDLHYEFYGPDGHITLPEKLDVLILAGDIATPKGLRGALTYYAERVPNVLYVPGNHDFYGREGSIEVANITVSLREKYPGFRRLVAGEVTEIQGVTFAGDTLWFGDPDNRNHLYEHAIPDFRSIWIAGSQTSAWIARQHQDAQQFFAQAQADVFVTHHMPSTALISHRYKNSPINRFFASDVFAKCEHPPRVWCYGHTHEYGDRRIDGTRFLCNPRGYPGENQGQYSVKLFTVKPDL